MKVEASLYTESQARYRKIPHTSELARSGFTMNDCETKADDKARIAE